MANAATQSPMILDTTGAVKTTPIFIETIRWVGVTGAGTVVVKDPAGNVIWASSAAAAKDAEESTIMQWFGGLTLDTLGSGKLYVYYH